MDINNKHPRLLGEGKVRENRLKHLFVYGLLAIPILHFFVFYILINGESLLLPFRDDDTGAFTLDHFVTVFENVKAGGELNIAFRNTMIYFFAGLFCQFVLSLSFTYFLYKKIALYRFFTFIFMIPSMVSGVVLVAIYKNLLDSTGPIAVIYENIFNTPMPPLLYSNATATWTIVAFHIWTGFGMNVILFSGAMSKIPTEIVEAANLDGVGFIREFFTIELPLIMPTVLIQLLFSLSGFLGATGNILLFTGGMYETTTISYWFYETVIVERSYGLPAAFGLLLSLVSLPLVLWVNHVSKKVEVVEY